MAIDIDSSEQSRARLQLQPILRITNERIKFILFLIISYITFNTTSEYNNYCITTEYKHMIRIAAKINIYSWHDEALIYKLWQ